MKKNILYSLALCFLIIAGYFVYNWFEAEPDNREPLPALLTLLSTIIFTIIAWRVDGDKKSDIEINNIEESLLDIDSKKENHISVTNVKRNSKIFINKGRKSFKEKNNEK